MSAGILIAIAALGGLGAIGRFALDGAVSGWTGRRFPYGTLVVNVLGTFALGILVQLAPAGPILRLVGTGVLGAFTTFSTWMLESHRLGEEGELGLGALNLVASLALGVLAAWTGRHVGMSL